MCYTNVNTEGVFFCSRLDELLRDIGVLPPNSWVGRTASSQDMDVLLETVAICPDQGAPSPQAWNSKRQAILTGLSRKGPWHLARTLATQVGMTNKWLSESGLISVFPKGTFPLLANVELLSCPAGYQLKTFRNGCLAESLPYFEQIRRQDKGHCLSPYLSAVIASLLFGIVVILCYEKFDVRILESLRLSNLPQK